MTPTETKAYLDEATHVFKRVQNATTREEAREQYAAGRRALELGAEGFVENVPRYDDKRRVRDPKHLHSILDQAHAQAEVAASNAHQAVKRFMYDEALARTRTKKSPHQLEREIQEFLATQLPSRQQRKRKPRSR